MTGPEIEPAAMAGANNSPQQDRLFDLLESNPGFLARAAVAVRIEGSLEVSRLERALERLVGRFEILRTSFEVVSGADRRSPQVATSAPVHLKVEPRNLSHESVPQAVEDFARTAVDLRAGAGTTPSALLWAGDGGNVLIVALPALACDARGLALLIGDLAELYRTDGEAESEPVQYGDVSEFFREISVSPEGEVARDFWRRQLWPVPENQWVQIEAGRQIDGVARVRVESALTSKDVPKELRAADWLALWAAFLSRFATAESISIGVATSGRRFEEIERALGLFDRHLPIVIPCSPSSHWPRIAAEVERLADEAGERLEAYDDRLGPGRGQPRVSDFGFEHRVAASFVAGADLRFTVIERLAEIDLFRFKLVVTDTLPGVDLELEYAALDAASAERLLASFRDFVRSAVERPEATLDTIETASLAELAVLDRERLANRAARVEPLLLHQLVAEQARRTPEAIALSVAGRSLDYQALDRAAGRLAGRLADLGVGPGSLVGLCVERSQEMILGLLAILDAGAAYLPLDPGYPDERLRFMVADAKPILVLTEERFEPLLSAVAPRLERLDRLVAWALGSEGEVRGLGEGPDLGPESLAYAIYTSGSTGRPKGVLIPHRAIANRLLWMRDTFPLRAGDSVLLKTPLSFDASVWEVFAPLLAGARLVVADPEGHRDPAYLARIVVEERITTLQLVPSLLVAMLEQAGIERWNGVLARLFCGGEALPVEAARRARERFGVQVTNLYGPTEAAIDATFEPAAADADGSIAPIGRPIENVDIHRVDRFGGRVSFAVPGEIWVGGVGLANGYLGRPDLTAERFTPDPFGDPGARVFRTGDLARRRDDGRIEFLGRIDHQVKIRGYRIEPQEIEAALERQTPVHRAAVVARRDDRGQPKLAAYLVAESGTTAEAVRTALARELPDYMVPATFTFLNRLPTSPSGKLDRGTLPAPGEGNEPAAPLSSVAEQVLGAIWTAVFGREVRATSDFFELGGNSLVATQVTSRVRQALSADLPIRALFETPMLRSYAARIEGALRGDALALPSLSAVPRDRKFPLSYSQQRLWFLHQLEGGGPSYNLPLTVRLRGELREERLAAAFAEVVSRHEVLRTTIEAEQGVPYQRIHQAGSDRKSARMPRADLGSLPPTQRNIEAFRLAAAEARLPFDLARGPLARAAFLKLAAEEALVLFTLHHLVSDGWSLGVLAREVGEAYRARGAGEPSRLPPLAVQYADYAVWQRELLDGDGGGTRLAEAARRLAGAPPILELPFDRPRPAVRSFRGGRRRFTLASDVAERLAVLARREAATPFMAAFAAFFAWLARQSGLADLVVGTPTANRSRPEIEPLIGFFVNTLVVRVGVDPKASFAELVGSVREAMFAAALHEDLPFERLVDAVQPERSLSHTPLFQVMFAYQNAPQSNVAVSDLTIEPLDLHSATSKFDLTLELMEGPRGLTAVAEYSSDLFDPATVERFAASIGILFEGAAADPECRLGELPLLATSERHALLYEDGANPVIRPAHRSAHTLAERIGTIAAARPDAIAVVLADQALSYGELLRRADFLAARIAEFDSLGSELLVGLLFERSLEMMVAIVGTLRAGAAYVPLDPDYPSERLEFLLADSDVRVLVTDRPVPATTRAVILTVESEPAGARTWRLRSDSAAAAYVIYTSGSTGKPKGVLVSHQNVLRLFSATERWYRFDADDVWSMFHSYAFDFSVWEIFGALLYGGRLVIVPRNVARSNVEFHELIVDQRVTMLSQTPSAFRQLVLVEQAERRKELALRAVVFGGEALDFAALVPWWRRFGENGPALINMYGITETTVHVTYRPIGPADFGQGSLIGGPIPDLRIRLLDAMGELAPIGVAAEIHVGGAGVARGYLRRPDLTAERFVPDPVADEPGARLYASGDLARRRPNGDLEYLGRRDHQVKVRGFRIELGEIEAALTDHGEVRGALALLRRDLAGETRLIAYVASDRQGGELAVELRAALARRLPDYMQPAAIVTLAEFPLTAHGKIDRGALPLPSHERPELASAYAEPATQDEVALATAWAAVLGLDRVGIDDNFFALGGDSMRIVQVLARVRDAGVDFAVQDLYQHQTIRTLAAATSRASQEAAAVIPDEDDLDDLMAEVEGLSEAEVRALIEQRLRAPGSGGSEE